MKKLNQKGNTVLIILITVILTTLIIGGGMYIWQNTANKKSERENMSIINNQVTNSQVEELQQRGNELREQRQAGALDSGEVVVGNYNGSVLENNQVAEQNGDVQTNVNYKNKALNFELTMPSVWKNYKVIEKNDEINGKNITIALPAKYFGKDGYYQALSIIVVKPAVWEKQFQSKDCNNGKVPVFCPRQPYLKSNSYYYIVQYPQRDATGITQEFKDSKLYMFASENMTSSNFKDNFEKYFKLKLLQ